MTTARCPGNIPVLVDLDGKGQGAEEPQICVLITKKVIGNQPCLRAALKRLQLLLDSLDLSRVAAVGWAVELGDKLNG